MTTPDQRLSHALDKLEFNNQDYAAKIGNLQTAVTTATTQATTATTAANTATTQATAADQSRIAAVAAATNASAIKVPDGSITKPKIAKDAVTANEIAPNAVTTNELAPNAVTTSELADGSVTTAKIDAGLTPANAIILGGSVDLNSVTMPRFYKQNSTSNAASGSNYPEPLEGSLEVMVAASNTVTQRYTVSLSNLDNMHVRTLSNGVWGAWASLHSSRTIYSGANYRVVDGTLLCWGVLNNYGRQWVTFPVAFASTPSIQCSWDSSNTSTINVNHYPPLIGSASATSFYAGSTYTHSYLRYHWFAIGDEA